jgi:hypothetical protein
LGGLDEVGHLGHAAVLRIEGTASYEK